ncbi:MAG: DUF1566 domain-containing protein [Campylobacterota bacterium]|nr:DUF1566 domain-containing protein [Campylobacterota bacterium]
MKVWKKVVVDASKNGEFKSKYYWVDKDTNLMWQLQETDEQYKWDFIDKVSEKLNNQKFGGFDDWRVPTIDEFKTILLKDRIKDRTYWSSSTVSNNTGYAWIVNFNIGDVSYSDKKANHYICCVRRVGE